MDKRSEIRSSCIRVSVNETVVVDRKTLSDYGPEDGVVYVFQALSGG